MSTKRQWKDSSGWCSGCVPKDCTGHITLRPCRSGSFLKVSLQLRSSMCACDCPAVLAVLVCDNETNNVGSVTPRKQETLALTKRAKLSEVVSFFLSPPAAPASSLELYFCDCNKTSLGWINSNIIIPKKGGKMIRAIRKTFCSLTFLAK